MAFFSYLFRNKRKTNKIDSPTVLGMDDPWYMSLDLDRPVVNLDNRLLGDEGVEFVASHQASCNVLYLSRNGMRSLGAKALGVALEQPTVMLTVLCLTNNNVGTNGVRALAHALRFNTSLAELLLGTNMVGDAGARALGHVLDSNTTLQRLDLGQNNIGDSGAQALASGLEKNEGLQKLMLWGNHIGQPGAVAMARALHVNTALKELCLLRNRIGDYGAKALAEALEVNQGLESLVLSSNKISDDSVPAFVGALIQNNTLQTLDLQGNLMTEESKKAIAQVTFHNAGEVATYLVQEPVCSIPDLLAVMHYNSVLVDLKMDGQAIQEIVRR